jgi:hypothetical protein
MAIDFTTYNPPGIYTESVGGPQLAVRSTVPTAVAIFGTSVGYKTYREAVKINSDAANTPGGDVVPQNSKELTKAGIKVLTDEDGLIPSPVVIVVAGTTVDLTAPGSSLTGVKPDGTSGAVTLTAGDLIYLNNQTPSTQNGLYTWNRAADDEEDGAALTVVVDTFKLLNPDTGKAYIRGLDYLIVKTDSGAGNLNTTRDDKYAIRRIDRGATAGIQEGKYVQAFYRYTSKDYHAVHALYDYDDVRELYGEPFDSNGNILSEITLAAKFAFINGASTVLTCAIDRETYPSEARAYEEALKLFRDEDQIAIIVPGTGDSYIYELVKEHVNKQSENKYERRALLGIDGSVNSVETSIRQGYAETLSSSRIGLITPSRFEYYAPELSDKVILGGQYMAAAVAGKSVSQIASMPLTRKVIDGFVGPAESPMQREGEKDLETQAGLMVIEKTRRNQVQVRHGVTTDFSELLTREWSIIGQQDVMVYRVRDFLDADGLIGMPIYDTTLIQVKASAEAALQTLIRDGIIVGYQNLKVRQIATLPDVIEVRYEWKPAYPLNYIVVRYSVAVMTGDVTITNV